MGASEKNDPSLLIESVDLIGSSTISGLLYGAALTLYCFCVHFLYRSPSKYPERRKHILFPIHATILVVIATLFLGLTTRNVQMSYVYHKDYPGGPFAYKESALFLRPSYVLSVVSSFLLAILTLGIQIWRLWVIWSGTRFAAVIMILPVFFFLSFFILSTLSIVIWSLPVVPIPVDAGKVISTVVYGLSFATTTVITLLVSARILLIRRNHIKVMGKSQASSQYMNIVTILIESYALESAWSLIATVLDATNQPTKVVFIQCENYVRVIAYYLVLYRISTGRAWTPETERQLTSIRWNRELDSDATDITV